jgi:spore coat polysaccharide biosynthesis protein SpsF (cytidylyltransferase family)
MGSKRLPGKVLAPLGGQPLVQRVLNRVGQIAGLDGVVLATTDRPEDVPLLDIARRLKIPAFAGSEDDVLDRYYRAAVEFGADIVVRATADCPLFDPEIGSRVLAKFQEGGFDYVSNAHPPTFPDGLDTEVTSFAALECAWHEAELMSEREHVTPFLWKRPERFRLANVVHSEDLSRLRWTVDEAADMEFVREVYRELGDPAATDMASVLTVLERHSEFGDVNAGIQRNEGYQKSLRADALLRKR